ncbi:mitochondrial import protein Pam17-domain-containing protein [Lasiosphaeria miniovina]|uniref:Presequence translocated-associated motor subunit PAM17 n=1 Tax=Lasiosphaeria miniovina TaxID=1954250 RepID=A0AA40BHU4_9PEZI|nr:mitochondrial import protein Pam17-domain-containing protein [Lasiosphaeria miniovina]KAK0734506.1 mitochondrial import protein Pam17-domain-containing protein [Lasiosphaeria miniovina]
MLTSTATSMIRTGVGRSSNGLQPILFRNAACPYSAASAGVSPFSMAATPQLATRPSKQSSPAAASAAARPQAICIRPISTAAAAATPTAATATATATSGKPAPSALLIRFRTQQQQRRNASTTTTTTATQPRSDHDVDASAAQAAANAQAAAHPEQPPLDWNTFFKLRKTRRRLQLVLSVATALGTSTGGALFVTTSTADRIMGQVPLDPIFTMGIITMSFAALGWLVGPSIGTAIFNALRSSYKSQMAVKESQLFARIKKHRVDPSTSSMGNPVPDFYGEKISSVAGYRQWLRDQRAFNKKRTTFV